MRRSASLHRTLLTACCSSEEENLLDCEEPRRYGRRASRLLCSVPMSSRLKWFLASERVQPRESRFEDFFLCRKVAQTSSDSQTRPKLLDYVIFCSVAVTCSI